jgi:hypothetical protein
MCVEVGSPTDHLDIQVNAVIPPRRPLAPHHRTTAKERFDIPLVGRHLTNDPLIDSGTGLSSRVSRVSHMATSIATPGDAVKRYRIAGAGAGRPQLERHPPRPAMSANTTTAGDTTRSDAGRGHRH